MYLVPQVGEYKLSLLPGYPFDVLFNVGGCFEQSFTIFSPETVRKHAFVTQNILIPKNMDVVGHAHTNTHSNT